MKLPNFVNPSGDSSSKIWHDFSNKVVQKLKLLKKWFYKKCGPLNEIRKIRMVLNIKKNHFESQILTLFDNQEVDEFTKFIWLQLIFDQKSCL